MPEADGKLTEEDIDRIHEWMEDNGISPNCSQCRSNRWFINTHLMSLTSLGTTQSPHGRVCFPAILLHCGKCGFTRIFSAVVMGIKNLGKPISDSKHEQELSV